MKILAIGDPHGSLDKIKRIDMKGVDLILVTGDLGKADLARKRFFDNLERKKKGLEELKTDSNYVTKVHLEIHNSTINVLKYLSRFAPVYTLQGNVGIPGNTRVKKEKQKWGLKLPSTMDVIRKMKNVHLVKNQVRVVEGIRIGFLEWFVDTNWVRDFKPADYKKMMSEAKKETEKAKKVLKRFENLDILVHHQPPHGFLDKVNGEYGAPKRWHGKNAGSKVILNYIRKNQPPYAFCGHIHEGEGKTKIGKTKAYNLGVGKHNLVEI